MQALIGFEFYFAFKQRVLIVLSFMAFAYGYLINSQPIGEGMAQLALNSPYRTSYFLILVSTLLSFVAALLTMTALLKDQEHRFINIIRPLCSRALYVSRWLTIIFSTLLVSVCLVLGMLAALLMADSAKLDPLNMGNFIWPWLVVVLPNTMLVCALLITATTRWRNSKITYGCSLLLVALAGTALIVIKAPINGESLLSTSAWTPFFAIADPFAVSAFFEQTQFWLPQQKNQQWFQLSGYMLLNRIWVCALSLLLFVYLWRTARTSYLPRPHSAITVKLEDANTPPQVDRQKAISSACRILLAPESSATRYWLSTLFQQVVFQTGQLLASWPIRILLLLWWCMVLSGILMAAGVFSSDEFSGKYITSASLIRYAGEAFGIFSQALFVFVIAECIWQERELKIGEMIFSTSLHSMINYFAKLISVMTIPLIMLIGMIGSCIVYQVSTADSSVEWMLYGVSSYYFLLPALYHAVLIFFIQTLIAQKTTVNQYMAMTVSAGVLVGLNQLLRTAGKGSAFWQLNQFPDLSREYSALARFAGQLELFNVLAVYWGVLALAIALCTQRWWLRRERFVLKTAATFKIGILFLSVFVLIAVCVQSTLPEQARRQSDYELLAAKADYEKTYRAFATQPHPEFSQTSVTLDIYPEQRLVNIQSHNQITNHASQPITSILVTTKQPLQSIRIETGSMIEKKLSGLWNTYRFVLSQPMQPGASLNLDYRVQMRSHVFAINRSIVENGVYLHQGEFEPLLGYAAMLEIDDGVSRKQFGLAERSSAMPSLITQKRRFSARLSTTSPQIALTSGELVRQWEKDGRSYYQYEMPENIYPVVGYFSARYQKHQVTANGIPMTLYFHHEHKRNVTEITKSAIFTMEAMQRQFGDYPYASLKIIEVPNYHPFGGRASAGIVALNEALYLQDYQDGAAINNVARNTIHEVAHQWFGEKLRPKITRGEKVLTESIVKEIEASLLGQLYGENMQTNLMAYNLRRYQSGRAFAHQDPASLLSLDQQAYIAYGKGPIVMQALKKHLGEDKYHAVLKNFIELHQHDMQATLPELVALFAEQSPMPNDVHRLFDWM